MQIINTIIYLLPGILAFLIIYLIICIVSSKENVSRWNIAAIIVVSVILAMYYVPVNNILAKYDLPYIQGQTETTKNISVSEPEDVNKILEVINKHTFTRSAVRTVEQQSLAGDRQIILSTHDYNKLSGKLTVIHLYVYEEPAKNTALQINEQFYNAKDSEGLSRDIFNVLAEIGLLK
ncbi:MAG: hypothetical protein APF77_20375 [Clostridia bacterium BRH_c25]|nr:MAG: hypothetical protein APF77_20375 [Clostridia bacterium BRH_c25]